MVSRFRGTAIVLLIVLAGFLAGVAVPEVLRMGTGTYAGFFSIYSFRKYSETAVAASDILPYVLSVRLKTLIFLWMSSYTAAGLLIHLGYAWWLSCSAGMLLSLFTLRDGYEGVMTFFCCLFPQWILYAAVGKREAAFAARQWKRSSSGEPGRIASWRRRDLAELGRMAGLCILGCAAETFLGTWTLKIFLQLFT